MMLLQGNANCILFNSAFNIDYSRHTHTQKKKLKMSSINLYNDLNIELKTGTSSQAATVMELT